MARIVHAHKQSPQRIVESSNLMTTAKTEQADTSPSIFLDQVSTNVA